MCNEPCSPLEDNKIGVIGIGTIGGALVWGLLENDVIAPGQIVGSTAHRESAQKAEDNYGLEVGTDNCTVAKKADILILAVKP